MEFIHHHQEALMVENLATDVELEMFPWDWL